jgi:hypothetical protein
MDSVKSGNHEIEETILHIVNAPSQGAGQVTRESSLVERANLALPQRDTVDVLHAFKTNLDRLDELSSRLGFVMTEVRSVVRR